MFFFLFSLNPFWPIQVTSSQVSMDTTGTSRRFTPDQLITSAIGITTISWRSILGGIRDPRISLC